MVRDEPYDRDESARDTYECGDCGNRLKAAHHPEECPECGGTLVDITTPRE